MPLRCNMMIFAVFHLYIQANVNCRPETEKSHRVNHASRVWSLTCRLHDCKSRFQSNWRGLFAPTLLGLRNPNRYYLSGWNGSIILLRRSQELSLQM